jgi:polar amino acid transport system substrate-binding protein
MVTDPYLGWYLKRHPEGAVKVAEGHVREPELQWNVAVGLRNADEALLNTVNQALDRLLADGTVQGIFAKYGVTYTPPHAQ